MDHYLTTNTLVNHLASSRFPSVSPSPQADPEPATAESLQKEKENKSAAGLERST